MKCFRHGLAVRLSSTLEHFWNAAEWYGRKFRPQRAVVDDLLRYGLPDAKAHMLLFHRRVRLAFARTLRIKRAFLTRPEKKNLRCKEITLAGFS